MLGNSMSMGMFFTHAFKYWALQDPDNRDVEQLGLIRLCAKSSAWHIPIIRIAPMHLLKGMSKKSHTRAPYEIHALESVVKKDIPMLMCFTNDISVALMKSQG
jgi:hypothetical protein